VENEVVIGAGAIVLGPITIGEGSKIGANSVVLKDVKPYTTVVGVPAREAGKHVVKNHHIDLDHAKIMDPIRNIVDGLNKRIKKLEEEVENLKKRTNTKK
jgi:serine O-acetyltransferase